MNRRKFTQSVASGTVVSMLANPVFASKQTPHNMFMPGLKLSTADGLHLTLTDRINPTNNQDHKQFTLTFKVEQCTEELIDKIYDLTDNNGKQHQIYLKPISHNQLQADFNWRTYA